MQAALAGGWYTPPFPIPADMDVTRPSSLTSWLTTAVNSAIDGQAVVLGLTTTITPPGGPPSNASLTQVWNVPNGWVVDDTREVLLTTGPAYTWPARTFAPTDVLGLLFQRLSTHGSDNFAQTTKHAAALLFSYYRRCQYPAC